MQLLRGTAASCQRNRCRCCCVSRRVTTCPGSQGLWAPVAVAGGTTAATAAQQQELQQQRQRMWGRQSSTLLLLRCLQMLELPRHIQLPAQHQAVGCRSEQRRSAWAMQANQRRSRGTLQLAAGTLLFPTDTLFCFHYVAVALVATAWRILAVAAVTPTHVGGWCQVVLAITLPASTLAAASTVASAASAEATARVSAATSRAAATIQMPVVPLT